MAKKNKTRTFEVVIIADRSGSMDSPGILNEAINGYNTFIDKQHDQPGITKVTTVLFDDQYEMLYNSIPLDAVAKMTKEVYVPRGSTALLDAIGQTIEHFDKKFAASREGKKTIDEDVIVCIITDGFENASKRFNNESIKQLIAAREKMGWEFVYLAASADKFTRDSLTKSATMMGFNAARTVGSADMTASYSAAVAMSDDYRTRKLKTSN